MIKWPTVLLLLVLCAGASAATKTVWRTDKADAIAKLNDDLKQATAGATLNSKQRRELNKSQNALQNAVEARNDGKSVNSQALIRAFKNIETMNKADVFTSQDKKAINKDLGKLKDQIVTQPRKARRDPYGYPYPRRRFPM